MCVSFLEFGKWRYKRSDRGLHHYQGHTDQSLNFSSFQNGTGSLKQVKYVKGPGEEGVKTILYRHLVVPAICCLKVRTF
jgi:hypothetical protein